MRPRTSPRRLALVALAALAATALAAGLLLRAPGDAEVGLASATPAAKRKPAPELEGEWLVPPAVRVAGLRGRPALVNFWASWCAPCREEAPELARFDRELGARSRLIGVDYQDAKADARSFIREFGWRFPNVADPSGKLASRYGLAGLPTTFVIDRQGRIARALTGAQSFDELVRAIGEVE